MKQILTVAVVFSFALSLSTTLLFAENQNSTSSKDLKENYLEKKQEFRSNVMEKKESTRQAMKDKEASKRAEIKNKIDEKRKELLNKRFTYLSRHLNAYLERLGKIQEKIVSRINKLKTKGVDTSTAEAKLAEVGPLKDAAKTAIGKAILDAQSVATATDPKAAAETAVQSVKAAKTALFNYHKKLVEVIRELKASKDLREGTASAN